MSGDANDAVLEAALAAFDRQEIREADVYVQDLTLESIAVAGGSVETVENKEIRGAGVRVILEGRVGFAHTTDLSAPGIEAAVRRAAEASQQAGADPSHRLPPAASPADLAGNADPEFGAFGTTAKVDLARRLEAAALAHDPRVRRIREARYQDVAGSILLARADGYRYEYRTTRAFAYVDVVAEEGTEAQSGMFVDFAVSPAALGAEGIGAEAAARAVAKLGGRPCGSRRAPLLLAPEVVDGLLDSLAPVFFADHALKGKSLFAGHVGMAVASPAVTLRDDGRLPGGCDSAPIDGEGVATGPTTLLEGGLLRRFLHTGFSACRAGEAPTGNAGRDSYLSTPAPEATALCLLPTGESRAELFAQVGEEGLLIEEVMGLHTINPISGDFSVGALGRAVRGGEAREAIAGIAIAGNVRDLLQAIVAVATDVRRLASGHAVSTVLLEGISVSGDGQA
jgi:PmbA protein